jgi:hypothetical protein
VLSPWYFRGPGQGLFFCGVLKLGGAQFLPLRLVGSPYTAFAHPAGTSRRRESAGEPVSEVGVYTEKAMPRDYYPLLARAIASLEQNTTAARQAVYDHARRVLREQVRDLKPALSIQERIDEMLALERAIDKAESEAAGTP